MPVNDASCFVSVEERKEKVEAALVTLKSLKTRVSELRVRCEELKKLESGTCDGLVCSECGRLIERGEEVTLKDSFGKVTGCYHKNCFKAIWVSQNWKFDYSSPGFLRMAGADK